MSLPTLRISGPNAFVKVSRRGYSSISEQINRFLAEMIVARGNDSRVKKNTLLGPNEKFPFPGHVKCNLAKQIPTSALPKKPIRESLDTSKLSMNNNNHLVTVFAPNNKAVANMDLNKILAKMVAYGAQTANYIPTKRTENLKVVKRVELTITACPRVLQLELTEIFKDIDLSQKPVTVLSITSIKAENANTKPDAELERMQLPSMFVEVAHTICIRLHMLGYWANFIDPVTGRPNEGRFAPVFGEEGVNKYKHLGFEIQKMGNCNVIRNVAWKDKFLGSIFTNAPSSCEALHKLVDAV